VPAHPHRLGDELVGDPADDVVGEPDALALRGQQAPAHRPVHPGRAVLDVEPGERGQVVEGERRAEHRGLGQEVGDGVARVVQPRGDRLGQRRGHRRWVGGAGVGGETQQLGEEER
jgi:hypothetical protein